MTIHVTEDGTESGVAVQGAKFVRTDSLGNIYGSEVITTSNGNAVFNYVPFAENSAPNIYYKQIASDNIHEFDDEVQAVTLSESTKTIEIINALAADRMLKLTDANYLGLPIENATLSINEDI